MATYRCLSCGGIYVDPQPPGIRFFHTCTPLVRNPAGELAPTPQPRDENPVVDQIVGKDIREGRPFDPADLIAHVRARGRGRVKLSDQDVITGADAAGILALQQQAGVPVPEDVFPGNTPAVIIQPVQPPQP